MRILEHDLNVAPHAMRIEACGRHVADVLFLEDDLARGLIEQSGDNRKWCSCPSRNPPPIRGFPAGSVNDTSETAEKPSKFFESPRTSGVMTSLSRLRA